MKYKIVFWLLLFSQFANAQFNKNTFGKNRVQHKKFDWQYMTTNNFEIYFYEDGQEIAELAAQYAENNFSKNIDLIGFSPYNKIKIFIYNSVVDLQQSNIGVDNQDFAVGGQTNFIRNEVGLAFTGDRVSFQKSLQLGVARTLISEMMYGGNLKDIFQNAYLLILPEWFMEGAAHYIAEGWSEEMDDYLKDMFNNRKLKRPSQLSGRDAQIVGQSIWNYVVEEYGALSMASTLNLTRIIRNEESSLQNTLGVSYNRFIKEWQAFYQKQYDQNKELYSPVLAKQKLKQNQKDFIYNQVKFSPDGKNIVFSQNQRGRYHVIVKELATGKEKNIFAGGYKLINQRFNANIPLLSWKNAQTVFIAHSKKGQIELVEYDLKTRQKQVFPLANFTHINDFAVQENKIVMSAETRGQSDIYVYDLDTKKIKAITNDIFDDLSPVFVPNTEQIVFSSNRPDPDDKFEFGEKFNLFLYNTDFKRLTNTVSTDLQTVFLDSKTLIYKSNQSGINNLYRLDLEQKISSQISNFSMGIKNFDSKGKNLAFVMLHEGKETLFLYKDFDSNKAAFTPKTFRRQILDVRQFNLIKKKNEKPIEELPEETTPDTLSKTDNIDTENYQFEVVTKIKKKKLLKNYNPSTENTDFQLSKPKEYESKFSMDNVVSSIIIDPLRDWGLVFEVGLSDALENHKFKAGIFNLNNISNNSYYAEYEFLKHRFDYRFRVDRQRLTIVPSSQYFTHAYILNKVQASISYPLNITTRFTASPFYASTSFVPTSEFDPSVQLIPVNNVQYGGFMFEFVYDNSRITGVNMSDGAKVLARYENYFGLNKDGQNFGNLMVDARIYKKVANTFIFAGRLSYGQFLGVAKKNYRLGGMDNWILYKTDPVPNKNPLYIDPQEPNRDYSDLLFTPYITNLRGFNFNKLSGNNYILTNLELRFPLLKYFYKSSFTSNFFRNLQVVSFFDAGAAWTGVSPFNRQNALNTEQIDVYPFSVKVSNFKNPFLMSYGLGVRTMVLGYYTKFDVAWGVDDRVVQNAQYYITLGYDF